MRRSDREVWFRAPADLWVFLDNGQEVGTLVEYVKAEMSRSWRKVIEDIALANIANDVDTSFTLTIKPSTVTVEGREAVLCVRHEDEAGQELHPMIRVEVEGRAQIQVSKIPLEHKRLGETAFAYGTGEVGGKPAVIVATENIHGGTMTVRLDD